MFHATLLLQTKLIMNLLFPFLAWLYLNHLLKHYFSSKLWPVLCLFWSSNFILTDLTSFFAQTDHTIERANVNKQFSGGKNPRLLDWSLSVFFVVWNVFDLISSHRRFCRFQTLSVNSKLIFFNIFIFCHVTYLGVVKYKHE